MRLLDSSTGRLHIRRPLKYRGYVIEIQGRIDGLYELPGQIDVEEIKSVILNHKDFKALDLADYPEYSDQVLIYSYLVHLEKPGVPIQPLLVLVNLVNDKVKTFRLRIRCRSGQNPAPPALFRDT